MDSTKYENIVPYLRDGEYPTGSSKQEKSVLRRYTKKFTFNAESSNLFYLDKGQNGSTFMRLVIKEEEKLRVFQECHSSDFGGHAGRDNTIQKIKDRYYWPQYYNDTVEMIKNSDRCQRNSRENKSYNVLHPVKVTAKVWYLVGIDLIDASRTSAKGNRYLLTQTDYFSKYVEAIPLPDKSALSVAKGLYKTYCRHGAPAHIISDQGRDFVNQVCEQLMKTFRVQHRITSSYHPQSNGLDERSNQSIKSILRKVMDEQDDNWDDYIDGALFAINTNVSTTTKCSPFFVMFGRHPRMPFEVEKFVTPLEEGDEAINNVMTELCSDDSLQAHIEKMTEIRDAVFPKIERNIDVAQQKQKQQYLKRTGGLKFTFNNGDTVLRRNMLQKTSKGHKMEDQWIGPYTVEGLDLVKGTCQLRAKDRRLLQRKINLKDLKLYREQSTSQTPSNDALLQESSAQQHPTLPQDSISAVPQNNQSGGSSVWQPTQSTQLSGAAVQQPAPTPTTSQPDVPATHRTAQSTSQPRGAGVQQPVRITTTSQPGGWATQRPTPSTSQPGGAGVQQPASMPTTSQPGGPVTQRPTPSTSQPRGAGVRQPAPMPTTSQPSGPVTQRPAPSTSQPGGAGVQQPVRIPSTSQPGGPATQRPVTLTSQPGRAGAQQPAPTQTTSQPGGPAIQRPAPSTSQPGGAEVQQPVQRPVPSRYDQRGAGVAEPAPNTNESIGAARASPSTSSNLGEEAVQQAPLLGNLHGARDFRSLSNKLKAITEQDIIVSFNEVILGVLSSILDGTNNSWRYNVYCRKTSLEGVETIDRDDLKFNVTFGDFDENQAYAMLQLIAKHFPKLPSTCLTEVLLPEALVHLCCHRLDMTYDQAETFLSLGGEDELGDFMAHLKNKVDKKTKKKRNNFGQKRKNCAQDGEVEFIKRCKMNEQAILKMQRPKFNLEPEDSAISKTAMLTDKHIQMAQELLHRQFPHIEGLMSPSISTVQQFPVMRQEFVQVLHTGGLHWVTVSTIGCKGNNKVNLYDSLYHGISPQTEEQIASLLFVDNAEHIEVSIPPVVQQTNGTDCGVYAIAFATALCNNLDPTSLKFNRRAIRDHLWQALQCGHLSMFPFEKRRPQDQNKLVKISVYCECRMPYNPPKDKMAECTGCKKWFHKECQQIADKVFKFARFQWRCKTCSRGNLPVPPISTSS